MHVVPKKGGVTVLKNDKGELIHTRTITGTMMFIDYMKLNAVTRKDHFLLHFIDKMLDEASESSVLLFPRRIFRVLSDSYQSRRSREDYFCLSLCHLGISHNPCTSCMDINTLVRFRLEISHHQSSQ